MIAEWVAIFIAFLALIFTIWHARQAQRHNEATQKHQRLSVKPALSIKRAFSDAREAMGLFVINNGLGPGNIKNLRLSCQGKDPTPISDTADLAGFLAVLGFNPASLNPTLAFPGKDYYLKAGETFPIIKFDERAFSFSNCHELLEQISPLQKLRVMFDYGSLYEEEWPYDSNDHEIFDVLPQEEGF